MVRQITFLPDGSIPEVEMTTQGASGPLNALARMDAERACLLYGNARVEAIAADNEQLGGVRDDDAAACKYLDFGAGVSRVTLLVAPGATPTRIDLALDSSWGPSVGTVDVPGGGDGRTWTTVTAKVQGATGVRALWLRFSGRPAEAPGPPARSAAADLARVDWFVFER